MKKIVLYLLVILFFASCESQDNKESRLSLDQYIRKLNALSADIVSSRNDEGSQTRLSLNGFFDKYTAKIEEFNTDLVFEKISEKYVGKRDSLSEISRIYINYLINRKECVINLSDIFSKHKEAKRHNESYNEYVDKYIESSYSMGSFYMDMARKYSKRELDARLEFQYNRLDYLDKLEVLDSLSDNIISISGNYNLGLENLKLIEKVVVPINLLDSLNDWVFTSKSAALYLD